MIFAVWAALLAPHPAASDVCGLSDHPLAVVAFDFPHFNTNPVQNPNVRLLHMLRLRATALDEGRLDVSDLPVLIFSSAMSPDHGPCDHSAVMECRCFETKAGGLASNRVSGAPKMPSDVREGHIEAVFRQKIDLRSRPRGFRGFNLFDL